MARPAPPLRQAQADLFRGRPVLPPAIVPSRLYTKCHFIFVCKPTSHSLITKYISGVVRETHEETRKRGKTRTIYRHRWINDVPLRDGKDALRVNWFEIEIRNRYGEVAYRNSFITNLPISSDSIVKSGARTRWKVENETFNVLKTEGL
jgi:hypothetical protein